MKQRVRQLVCGVALMALPATAFAQLNDGVQELKGIIDIHQHVGPATQLSISRSLDAIEATRIAERNGMRAIVFKQHYLETASWAYLVSRVVPGIQLFGGIALNRSVGGLNPNAVEQVATFAGGFGRVVYFPTFESEFYNPGSPVAVPISKDGKLLPKVYEVLDVIKKYDMSMSTGHSSPQESLMLVKAAREKGINKIYVQHPALRRIDMPIDIQKECAQNGALLEYVLGEAIGNEEEFKHWADSIRAVGPQNVVISTDLGQRGRPIHVDGYKIVLPRLLKAGFTQAEIDTMTKTNPARFLGLEK